MRNLYRPQVGRREMADYNMAEDTWQQDLAKVYVGPGKEGAISRNCAGSASAGGFSIRDAMAAASTFNAASRNRSSPNVSPTLAHPGASARPSRAVETRARWPALARHS
jgi:hypothetical protein